ncbi:MAG TPA: UDP-N-acetylmuramoyl-L-alanine--D-glutamate ligase [Candidatus Moranbacteria bacterium]|nr:UDP-N-acetylmuramoyl-L-alanine--D-glutamate ligase [Candidatus Moranbacteria bacterium]HAT74635.1 UDP-N-acetylmuramoyl-L-alanine--D-glutamate ligase [Candidatus Moranbacteria bacterium]
MNIIDLKGKKITVMGLGLHGGGVGTVKFLSEAGACIIATDIKSKEELALSLEKLKGIKNASFVLGQHRPEDFIKTDLVIKNPAVSWNNKYIKLALDKKIPVEMDSSLFFKLCENKIIGVTGTKGKTTTAGLIYAILKTAKKDTVEAGISQTSVLDKLKNLKKETLVVFELSSWRLSALGKAKISPQISVITNIYPDHLNYYKSMDEYIADKENIFLHQKKNDICVINADSELLGKSRWKIPSQIVEFSREKIISDSGAFIKDGGIYFKNSENENKILDISEIKLKGGHNQENILAAVAVAGMLGINSDIIKKGILSFSGTPHRLELVRKSDGVEYYNDSAATTPESAISGINSFSAPIVLICGGANKNLDVSILAKEISKKVKSVIFLAGESTDKIIEELRKEIENKNAEFKIVNSMEQAVELARQEARSGDAVLLSPGASSFGLFVNEFDRGDQFREIVKNLK